MTKSKLTKLAPPAELLANVTPAGIDDEWIVAFNSAAVRQYLSEWPEWFSAQRATIQGPYFEGLRNETLQSYAKILRVNTAWFMNALCAAHDCDSEIRKPIFSLYFAAKIEALTSMRIYQERFRTEKDDKFADEVRYWLDGKIDVATSAERPEPSFLFLAMAGAYEHTFSFVFRMIDEFRREYHRLPSRDEFGSLSRQLTLKLCQEALLSRPENAVLETHLGNTDRFFSFAHSDDALHLDINRPTPLEKLKIQQEFATTLPASELQLQQERSAMTVHYGCPAAFNHNGGKSSVRFVVEDVMCAVGKAFWGESCDETVSLPLEKSWRGLINPPPAP